MTVTRRGAALERLQALAERNVLAVRAAGLSRVRVQDEIHDGGHVVIDGHRVVNMGSCAYLGLNVDDRLKEAAADAVRRFGPVFSSSAVYTSVGLYSELEEHLAAIMGDHVLVPTTTTLGHLSFFQVAPNPDDVILVDQQAHASIQMALNTPRSAGVSVTTLPHNDMDALARGIQQAEADGARTVWYAADGVYSMYGDLAPFAKIRRLLDRHPTLRVYLDDAHGFGWAGCRGRGLALEALFDHPRVCVAVSLSKSFGSGGAAIRIPDGALAERVLHGGGTMIFSGPLHPAELGAAVAAGAIHRSEELVERQSALQERIALMSSLLRAAGLPVINTARSPIWFIEAGPTHTAIAIGRRLLDRGYYTNVAAFPAVPHGGAGIRFTQTLYQSETQITAFVEELSDAWSAVSVPDAVDLRVS
jgi:7-keto-8-aminopelargonate synthetase-like enzyme